MKRPIVLLFLMAAVVIAIVQLSPEPPADDGTAPPDAEPEAATEAEPEGIAWFDGRVEDAFAAARSEDKPIFLYWGAEWCPPCAQIKSTIFRHPRFIATTRLFVPVYIDGDEPGAQRYQDRFRALGYPTLIVFNPQGEEITRIPGGLDLDRYGDVLELALERVTPVSALVARIMDDGYRPAEEELTLLAHYSWSQDRGQALVERDRVGVFRTLTELAPPTAVEERSLLTAYLLDALAEQDELDVDRRAEGRSRLAELLASDAASTAAASFVAYGTADAIRAFSAEDDPQRTELLEAWSRRLDAMVATPAEGAARLRPLFGQLDLLELRGEEVSTDLQQRIARTVAEERAAADSTYERIAVVNSASYLLRDSGQAALAEQMLREEMADDVNGYYWMLAMANLAEQADRRDEAVDWMRQAFDQARGPATRLQWGSVYVAGLVRLAAERSDEIESTVDRVMQELSAQPEPLHGRNKGAVKRIARALHGWAESSDDPDPARVLDTTTTRFGELCMSSFEAEDARRDCLALFDAPAGAEPVG